MNRENFLSQQNISVNYKYVCQNVQQRTGKNIARLQALETQFSNMAKIVADKSNQQELNNLSLLNNKLVDQATNFFCKQIDKRSGSSQVSASNEFNSGGYKELSKSDNPSGEYSSEVYQRNQDQRTYNSGNGNVYDMPVGESRSVAANRQLPAGDPLARMNNLHINHETVADMMLNRGQVLNQDSDSTPGANSSSILPFNMDDEVANMMSNEPGQDLPLYQNILDLQRAQDIDPMARASEIEQERQRGAGNKLLSYSDLGVEERERTTARMITRSGDVNGVMESRNNTDAVTLNQRTTLVDPLEMYKMTEHGKRQIMDRMTNGSVSGNDVRAIDPLADNLLMEKILSIQRDMQPKYMERTNYIIVNSVDRDWFGSPNDTRYSFRVNFKPNRYYQGAGIIDIYKNITSVELVNAVLPQDCVSIPFDNRVYIDILSFPYLLLQIPEITDVFRGTNSHSDRTFSILLFDKQHDGSVLSYDYISGASSIVNSTPTSQYYREYRKTFYKYTPAYFEKKQYYNQPLASLSHMTLNLATPAGENLNTFSDVLVIDDIQYSGQFSSIPVNSLEYDLATSYPNDSTWGTRQYVRIESSTCFSNKLFRLGDLIKIKGYGLADLSGNGSDFVNFINREEGHYILNTDLTNLAVQSGGANNQGFTGNIYIAPPGTLASNLCVLDPSTYYTINSTQANTYATYQTETHYDKDSDADIVNGPGKLINTNLQTHYFFKITTREGDVQMVTRPMNV